MKGGSSCSHGHKMKKSKRKSKKKSKRKSKKKSKKKKSKKKSKRKGKKMKGGASQCGSVPAPSSEIKPLIVPPEGTQDAAFVADPKKIN